MSVKCKIALLSFVVVLVSLVALSVPVAANASFTSGLDPLTDPWTWLDTSGDGGSISDYLTGTRAVTNSGVDGFGNDFMNLASTSLEEIPVPWEIGSLGTVVLGVSAFAVGLEIGTTANHIWSKLTSNYHFTAGNCTSASFIYYGGTQNFYGLHATCDGVTGGVGTPTTYSGSAAVNDMYALMTTENAIQAGSFETVASSYCASHTPCYQWVVPQAEFFKNEPVASDPGLSTTVTAGYANPSTGAGLTSAATAFNVGPSTPQPQCVQGGVTMLCTAVSPTGGAVTPVGGWPSGWVGTYTNANANNLRCAIDSAAFGCPVPNGTGTDWASTGGLSGSFTMPSCSGLSLSACESAITTAAEGAYVTPPTYDELTLSIGAADITQPAGAVITTVPAGATVFAPGSTPTTVTISFNPTPLPLVLPAPGANQTEADYLAALEAGGYTGTATVVALGSGLGSPLIGPNGVAQIATPYQTLSGGSWPVTLPRITPTDNITIEENPSDAPSISQSGECNTCTINWAPLENLNLGSKFPFGALDWFTAGLSTLTSSGTCPSLSITDPASGHVYGPFAFCSSEWESNFRPWVFPLIEAVMTLMALLFVALKIIGLGGDTA